MPCCDCSFSCCIFNDALLFCNTLEFVKLKTQPAPLHETACVLSDCEEATAFLMSFSLQIHHWHTWEHWVSCSAEQPTSLLVSDPSGGAFTRSLSAKHYAITNGLHRRQEAGAAGPLKAKQQPPPPPPFFPWIHLCPCMNSCFVTMQAHTHKQTNIDSQTWSLASMCSFSLSLSTLLLSCHISLKTWSKMLPLIPKVSWWGWEQWRYISLSGSWKEWRERIKFSHFSNDTPQFLFFLHCPSPLIWVHVWIC